MCIRQIQSRAACFEASALTAAEAFVSSVTANGFVAVVSSAAWAAETSASVPDQVERAVSILDAYFGLASLAHWASLTGS